MSLPVVFRKKFKKKNLFDVVFSDKEKGVGKKVTRKIWHRPDCYWTITRIKFTSQFPNRHKRGKAWGILTWRGVSENKEKVIRGSNKKEWKLYDPEWYKQFEDPTRYIQNQHLSGGVVHVRTDPGPNVVWDTLQGKDFLMHWQEVIRKEEEEAKKKAEQEQQVAKETLD